MLSLSGLLNPNDLRKAGICFDIVAQYPGDLIYTAPGTYHQVVNAGVNFAVAINCDGPEYTSLEEYKSQLRTCGYKWCDAKAKGKPCGDTALTEQDFFQKE